MLAHINFASLVKRTLLKMSLAIVRSSIGVIMSPGKLIISPPTVSQVQCVSGFCVKFSATILPYVTALPAGTFPLGINNIVLVPDVILVTNLCASRQTSFVKKSPNGSCWSFN